MLFASIAKEAAEPIARLLIPLVAFSLALQVRQFLDSE
jgi:hypothetical protein